MTPARAQLLYGWLYDSLGGSQIYLLKTAAVLRDRFRIASIMPATASAALQQYWQEIGAEGHTIDASVDARERVQGMDRLRRRLRHWRAEYALWRSIRLVADRRTILHLDISPWSSFWLVAALNRSHPVVITFHTAVHPQRYRRRTAWAWKLTRLTASRTFRIVAANANVRDSLGPYLPAERLRAVPIAYSPIDLEEVAAVESLIARDPAPVADRGRSLHVVTVGQFIERKGPWVLLEAARSLVAQGLDVQFTWLCPTPPDGESCRRIAAFGLGDRFRWRSFEQRQHTRVELLSLVARADLFVLPSLEEGLPLAIIEAMAVGVPVVVTRTNGVTEAVTDGTDGTVVEPGDAAGLSRAIATLAGDRDTRLRLGAAGRRRAVAQFSSEATASVLLGVYDDVLGVSR